MTMTLALITVALNSKPPDNSQIKRDLKKNLSRVESLKRLPNLVWFCSSCHSVLSFPLWCVCAVMRPVTFRMHRSHCTSFVAILAFMKRNSVEAFKHTLRSTSINSVGDDEWKRPKARLLDRGLVFLSSAIALASTCPSVMNDVWLDAYRLSGACALKVINFRLKMTDHIVLTSIANGSTAGRDVFHSCQRSHTHSISSQDITDMFKMSGNVLYVSSIGVDSVRIYLMIGFFHWTTYRVSIIHHVVHFTVDFRLVVLLDRIVMRWMSLIVCCLQWLYHACPQHVR